MRLGYETGNNPFYLRVPKEPYYKGHHLKREYPPISLLQLQTMIDTGRVDTSKPLDLVALCNSKLFLLSPLEKQFGFQLTDEGLDNFKGKVNIEVQHASEQVIAAIERNGGVITTAFYDPVSLLAMRDPMKFFISGIPIPKRQTPPEDAIEYYTDPRNRGYLADPDLVALERFKLAQKYGYELPDLKNDPELAMLLERKDPRQIFYGLNPGWVVNLKDKKIFEPEDEKLLEYYKTANSTVIQNKPQQMQSYGSYPTGRHNSAAETNQSYYNTSDQSSRTLPQKYHSKGHLEFSPTAEPGLVNYTSTLESRKPQQHPHKLKGSNLHTNLIEFGSPPSSPLKSPTDTRQAYHYAVPASRQRLESSSSVNSDSLAQEFSQLASDLHDGMEVGSLVEVSFGGRQLFGVVRWCGKPRNKSEQGLVGECDIDEGSDGSYLGQQFFRCAPGRGVFVPFRHCRADSRFSSSCDVSRTSMYGRNHDLPSEIEYGGPECPSVCGEIPPVGQFGDWSKLTGKFRGIQGHHNSCYLDATLFSMFTFTSIFDGLLYRPPTRNDIPQYEEVQRILKEEIVNPLRQNHYVRADKVMKLRRLLQKLGSVKGLTNEEKDPEEFLHCLLSQTLKAEPFLKLSSGQEAYHHQLFVEKDDKLVMPTVQQLFEQSFLSSGIKLKEVPPALIIQMPRFGKSYKMYPYVLPSSLLDITDVLENSPRQCIVCGHLAEMECQQCLGQCGSGLESIAFCAPCLYKVHSHKKRTTHQAQPLQVPADYAALQEHCVIPRMYMELFAVVCIATSHYVAFVKCGPGPDAPWCFFDSMADRKGEQNGFNIPEVITCPDLPRWLSDEWDKQLLSNSSDPSSSSSSSNPPGTGLPDYVRRLFSDAYMCLYQSPDLMLYR
uniref:ubiquitinyl hydrolase 1 n=1 Tax=Daphnia pulex TaxID=6669 RepID=A0A4Y7MUZ6_DAPPU|nr:EOG090X03LH [Daphnia pulex]